MSNTTTTIGAMVAHEMSRRGLTDSAAADLLGVSQPTVTRWRTMKSVPKQEHAVRLAAFTGLPLRKVERLIDAARPKVPPIALPKGPETFGVMLRKLERERGVNPVDAWQSLGIDKSRYYRFRADKVTPHLADIPALAKALKVSEERCVMAAYRTELARTRRDPTALQQQRAEALAAG